MIQDSEFIKKHSVDPETNFTRRRKLTFAHLLIFLAQSLTRSIQNELNSFFQKLKGSDFPQQVITKGALSQARQKLSHQAFIELNALGLLNFYNNAPYHTWKDFRLLAIDGSTLMLPQHETIRNEFGSNGFGRYADSEKSVARISLMYDVLNFVTVDAVINEYNSNERKMAYEHLNSGMVNPGKDLVIFDRGYPSLRLMYEMHQLGIDYCIRMRDDWWHIIRKMKKLGEYDKEVIFRIQAKDYDLLEKHNSKSLDFLCRIVAVDLPNGEKIWLATSVRDKDRISQQEFATLYHYRWGLEENFKLFKSRLQIEAFSGKTARAIRQDFHANVFLLTSMAVLTFPVEEKLKSDKKIQSGKHRRKTNRTIALSVLRQGFAKLFLQKTIRVFLQSFDYILSKTTELIRPGRRFARKKIKKKPPSMNYKQL